VFPLTPSPQTRSSVRDRRDRRARRSIRATNRPRGTRSSIALALVVLIAIVGAPTVAARTSVPTARTTGDVAVRPDATTTRLEGIDVSHWQGTISWPKVAAAGKRFAIIKATDGLVTSTGALYVDPLYATNHANAKAAGIWTGAYHFARPDATANDAVLEARHFASRVNLGAGDIIPALDLEVSGSLSIAALQAWVTTWLNEVTAQTGVRPMIYTSPAFWKKYMGDSSALATAGYKTLWIAHWNVTSPTVAASNWGGYGWTFWQYSNCGTVSGISGCVDLDRFNGADLTPVAYSSFKLTASVPSGFVKQGQSSDAIVKILRTNFSSDVALNVTGLPSGTTVTYDANPVSDSSAALTVTTPADPAATPTGTYPLTITGVAAGITRTTKLNLVVADGIPPTLVAPFTRLVTGTLGTSTVPVSVTWSASDPSGVVSCALQRSINGGTWSSVALPSATARTVTQSLPLGKGIQQRARATDSKANTSAWSAGRVVHTALTQQYGTTVTYTGTWRSVSTTSASGGSLKYATAAGASATFTFTGSSVAWVAARGPSRGSAKIYVDGVYVRTVNLSSSTGHSRAIAFVGNWAGNGTHTLRIVVVGTAGHPRVDIDAFVRLSLS
jgi:GH25 family lysozyme M1 (1,4-beta-N-acetylmuramidase)